MPPDDLRQRGADAARCSDARTVTWRAVVLCTAGIAFAVVVALVLARTASQSWAAVAAPGPAAPADGILLVLSAVGGLVAAWWGLSLALAALGTLPGAAGDVCRRLAERVTPAATRRAVAFLMGTTLTAALVPGTATANAKDPGGGAGSSVSRTVRAAGPAAAVGPVRTLETPPDPSFHSTSPAPAPDSAGAVRSPSVDVADPSWRPTRPPAPARSAPSLELLTPSPVPGRDIEDHVVVHRGDSLWSIAARHLGAGASAVEIAREWPRWYAANRTEIGDDPDVIMPGQQLLPPPEHSLSSTPAHDHDGSAGR